MKATRRLAKVSARASALTYGEMISHTLRSVHERFLLHGCVPEKTAPCYGAGVMPCFRACSAILGFKRIAGTRSCPAAVLFTAAPISRYSERLPRRTPIGGVALQLLRRGEILPRGAHLL